MTGQRAEGIALAARFGSQALPARHAVSPVSLASHFYWFFLDSSRSPHSYSTA